MRHLILIAALSLFASTARAQTPAPAPTPSPTAPANGDPAASAKPAAAAPARAADPAPAPAAATSAAADRAHIDAAVTFLKALAHTSHKGDQAAQAWSDLAPVAAAKVEVSLGGEKHEIDVSGKSTDLKLLNFSKIANWREGKDVKGVTVAAFDFKTAAGEHKGAGKVEMSNDGGSWKVTAITVE